MSFIASPNYMIGIAKVMFYEHTKSRPLYVKGAQQVVDVDFAPFLPVQNFRNFYIYAERILCLGTHRVFKIKIFTHSSWYTIPRFR